MTKRAEKRLKQKKKIFSYHTQVKPTDHKEQAPEPEKSPKNKFLKFYNEHYIKLLFIPILLFIFAISQISYQAATNNGDFINKDITLKGGIIVTVPSSVSVDTASVTSFLAAEGFNVNVRNIESSGRTIAVLIESDIDLNDDERIDLLLVSINEQIPFKSGDHSIEGIGSSISNTFFQQTIKAVFVAFILMGFVVFLYFGDSIPVKILGGFLTFLVLMLTFFSSSRLSTIIGVLIGIGIILLYAFYSIPSIAVILGAFSDIIITVAVVNLLGIKVSTAGIAAFLMLIGYSVDTNILLTTRVLKRNIGTILERIISAIQTGLLMSCTTLGVLLVALFISSSDVIRQIMTILFIGVLVDQINTWIQNVAILRIYLNNKGKNKLKNKNKEGRHEPVPNQSVAANNSLASGESQ
jgi:preprotein translocase subunit SecF